MSATCELLGEFLAEHLAPRARQDFKLHLGACTTCQGALHINLQLDVEAKRPGAGAELGHLEWSVRERAARCPQRAQHMPWPADPATAATLADGLLAGGYEQLQCGGCGLWMVWRKKVSRARGTKPSGQLKSPARATVTNGGDRNSRGRR